jgi:hypothetical protein
MTRIELTARGSVREVDPGADREPEESLLFTSIQVLWARPGALRVATQTVVREVTDASVAAQRSTERRIYEFDAGEIWTKRGLEPFRRAVLIDEQREKTSEWRRARVEWFDDLVLSGKRDWGTLEDEFGGSGRLRIVPFDASIDDPGARRVARVSVDPGLSWEIVSGSSTLRNASDAVAAQILVAVMGLSLDRAIEFSRAIDGTPLRMTARTWPVDGVETIIDYEVSSIADVDGDPAYFSIPADDIELDDARAKHPTQIDEVLAGRRAPSEPLDDALVSDLLRYPPSPIDRGSLSSAVDRTLAIADDPARFAVLRALARLDPDGVLDQAMALLSGERGLALVDVAAAIVAERHPRALELVARILGSEREYSDVPEGAVEAWAVRELRVLSGLSPVELEARLAEAGALVSDPDERLYREYVFWLRWVDELGLLSASTPRLPVSPSRHLGKSRPSLARSARVSRLSRVFRLSRGTREDLGFTIDGTDSARRS